MNQLITPAKMNDDLLEWLYRNSPQFRNMADRLEANRELDKEKTIRELELGEMLGLPVRIEKTK